MTPIACDVLIFGGGILGVWLLNRLQDEGFSTVLLERNRLGSEQTCHSQAFLHQGLAYKFLADGRREDYERCCQHFAAAWQEWGAWLNQNGRRERIVFPDAGARSQRSAYHAFRSDEYIEVEDLFEGAEYAPCRIIETRAHPIGSVVDVGALPYVYETTEQCVDPQKLLEELSSGKKGSIARVDENVSITLSEDARCIESIHTDKHHFRPRIVIFASSGWNTTLIQATWKAHIPPDVEQSAKSKAIPLEMLLIRAPTTQLPTFDGQLHKLVVDDNGHSFSLSPFIASRHEKHETIWMIMASPQAPGNNGVKIRATPPQSRQLIYAALQKYVVPFRDRVSDDFSFGIYSCPMVSMIRRRTETGRPVQATIDTETYFFSQAVAGNLWIAYLDRLTVTPLVVNGIVNSIKINANFAPSGRYGGEPNPFGSTPVVDVSEERWKSPSDWGLQENPTWLRYAEFRRDILKLP